MSTITAAEATLRRARELETLGASGKGEALDDLLKFLEGLRHFQWQGDKNIDTVFEETVRLAIETNRIKELRNPVSTMRRRARDHGTMEGYAKYTLEQGRKMVDAAIAAAKEEETKASPEELILRKMLGVGATERGLECHVGPAFQRYEDLVTTWLYALERERSEAVYQRIALEGLRLCAAHNRTDQITQINKLVQRHLNEVFEGETDDRKRQVDAIVSAPHAIEAIVSTKQEQVRIAGELRDWAAVTAAMRDMRRVVQKLAVHHADVNLDGFLELESEVLFAAHSHLLHADNIAKVAERRAARGDDAEMLASQAVIAALCVPDTTLSTDEAQDRIARLCRQVQIAVVPTRDSLLAALEKPIAGKSLLDRASPSVRALHALLAAAPTIEVCAKAAPLLAELEQHEKLARYVQVLQTVFVRAMLGIMSRCFSSLSIAEFVERCGGFLRPGTEDFAARVEPLLLQEMFGRRVHVMVDFGAEMINFVPAAVNNRNLTAFMGELCADVAAAVRPCYMATAAPSPSAPAKAAKDLEELVEQARDRTMARYMVGTKRLNNADVRLKAILEKEKQVKEQKRKDQWEREQARNKAARAKQDEAVQAEIRKEETLERRRLVARNLQNKYRGFVVPADLVSLVDETAFSNRVSTALARFLETRDSVRSSDLKAMEYWERACREVEKPLREAHTKQVAAENAREYALRAENRAKQHRKDWEDAKKLKERLGRLLTQKDAYEKQIRGSYEAQRAKTVGKRAEQQEALERAKAEREAAAGAN